MKLGLIQAFPPISDCLIRFQREWNWVRLTKEHTIAVTN